MEKKKEWKENKGKERERGGKGGKKKGAAKGWCREKQFLWVVAAKRKKSGGLGAHLKMSNAKITGLEEGQGGA